MSRALLALLLGALALAPAAADVRPLADRDHLGVPSSTARAWSTSIPTPAVCASSSNAERVRDRRAGARRHSRRAGGRTEASFILEGSSSVDYTIRCIATPGRRCRIDIRIYGPPGHLARRIVTIPRGRARKVHVPARSQDDLFLTVARAIDPDGRRRIAITF